MGYEVRALVVTSMEKWRDEGTQMQDGHLWVSVLADFWMGKANTQPYRELVSSARSKEDRKYFFYEGRGGGEVPVFKDLYDSPLQRLETKPTMKALEKSLQERPHMAPHRALLETLRVYNEVYEDDPLSDLFVLHYGY